MTSDMQRCLQWLNCVSFRSVDCRRRHTQTHTHKHYTCCTLPVQLCAAYFWYPHDPCDCTLAAMFRVGARNPLTLQTRNRFVYCNFSLRAAHPPSSDPTSAPKISCFCFVSRHDENELRSVAHDLRQSSAWQPTPPPWRRYCV